MSIGFIKEELHSTKVYNVINEGTIIAIATPVGRGAIGLIRLSGPESIAKTNLFFRPKSNKSFGSLPFNKVILGDFVVNNTILDEVLVTKFVSPNSYTGEDVVEISCHGSNYILQKIVTSFVEEGLMPAKEGEFTLRAYLNKKMDLSQAEAVCDIIASESSAAHEIAIKQLRGGYSNRMKKLRQELIKFKSLIELELDFGEEDVEFANLNQLKLLLENLHKEINDLKLSFNYGNAIKNGVPVAIAGKPNTGKSSLLNALFNEDKAIVSKIPGTTRDTIEDTLTIDGILFRFIDTAGLRDTEDVIEAIGVEKAKEKVKKSSILIYMYDSDSNLKDITNEIRGLLVNSPTLITIENKIDKNNNKFNSSLASKIESKLNSVKIYGQLGISTFNPKSLIPLKKMLVKLVEGLKTNSNYIIQNTRHYNALKESLVSVEKIQKDLNNKISGDLLSVELKEAIHHIGSITGEIDHDRDVLGSIFSQFCIGK